MREQPAILEHVTHTAAMRRHALLSRLFATPHRRIERDLAARKFLKARNDAQQRRFDGAARSADWQLCLRARYRCRTCQREGRTLDRYVQCEVAHASSVPWPSRAHERPTRVQRIHCEQHGEREPQQPRGQNMRLLVVQGFDMLVNRDRDYLRAAGYVAADHEHDTELAERMRKASAGMGGSRDRGIDKGRARRRKNASIGSAPSVEAASSGAPADCLERSPAAVARRTERSRAALAITRPVNENVSVEPCDLHPGAGRVAPAGPSKSANRSQARWVASTNGSATTASSERARPAGRVKREPPCKRCGYDQEDDDRDARELEAEPNRSEREFRHPPHPQSRAIHVAVRCRGDCQSAAASCSSPWYSGRRSFGCMAALELQ